MRTKKSPDSVKQEPGVASLGTGTATLSGPAALAGAGPRPPDRSCGTCALWKPDRITKAMAGYYEQHPERKSGNCQAKIKLPRKRPTALQMRPTTAGNGTKCPCWEIIF